MASKKGHLEIVQTLLVAGADVNRRSIYTDTPLHWACLKWHLEVVRALIAAEEDPNRNLYCGNTTMHIAADNGNLWVVRPLLIAGADVNMGNTNDDTPLHMASSRGHLEVVRALLSAGAAVNKSNNFGDTPLHRASLGGYFKGHLEVTRVLLSAGADMNRSNNDGNTPLDLASKNEHWNIVDLLLRKSLPKITLDISLRIPEGQPIFGNSPYTNASYSYYKKKLEKIAGQVINERRGLIEVLRCTNLEKFTEGYVHCSKIRKSGWRTLSVEEMKILNLGSKGFSPDQPISKHIYEYL